MAVPTAHEALLTVRMASIMEAQSQEAKLERKRKRKLERKRKREEPRLSDNERSFEQRRDALRTGYAPSGTEVKCHYILPH